MSGNRIAAHIAEKFPDRVPVIVERSKTCNERIPQIEKTKYLVPRDMTVAQFVAILRKRMILDAKHSFYMFAGDTIPRASLSFAELYAMKRDDDGMLRLKYTGENTFGCVH